jgi:3-deoxy-manno-octulosonate cytidylyltransferase (CMP-KDO synthetase)
MKAIGVIPARFGSTRFLGKPLAMVAGRPLLQWVIEGSKTSRLLKEIFVATDDERIADLARRCGVQAVMTDSNLPTGTDRAYAAIEKIDCDVVVNIQGDEPLIEGKILDQLIAPFAADHGLQMATLGRELDRESLESPQTAKIVLNHKGEALYFSRFAIPYTRTRPSDVQGPLTGALKHIGIYAYRREFLEKFCKTKPAVIERLESLEQLRALYLGARIKVVQVEHDSWGVDTPEDVKKIEKIMQQRAGGR